jgi:MATE family multidrug resistance protein
VQRGLGLALVLSVVLGACVWFLEPVLVAFDEPPEVVPHAVAYARIGILGLPAFFVFFVGRLALQSKGITRPIVAVVLAANALNAFLDWILIGGALGFEGRGAAGCSWATVVSRWGMLFGLLWLGRDTLGRALVPLRHGVLALRPLLRMIRIGAPVGLQYTLEMSAFALVALLMGRFGAVRIAGHHVAYSLAALGALVPIGMSMAASVRVGNEVGRGDPEAARFAARVALVGGVLVMVPLALAFLLLPYPLARIYTNEPDVLAVAVGLVPLAGLFQLSDGFQIVACGVLRGVADTRVPMLVHLAGYWLVGLPVGAWLAFRAGLGFAGLWWGLVAALVVVGALLFVRLRVRLGAALERVHVDGAERA